ncbi:MAG: YIP1 family protein [candidate division Zixibacteria bacterium]|nr:YIP1 family protein [candidate division Zixibacteria bacterium]
MDQVDVDKTDLTDERSGLSFRGLIEIFYRPSEFFEELKNHPKVLVPYIALAVLLTGFFYLAVDFIIAMQMDMKQVQIVFEGGQFSAEQMKMMMYYQTIIGGVLTMLLTPLLIAALGLFWGNFVFGLKVSFKKVLSVVLFGEFLYTVGLMAHLPIMFAKDTFQVSFSPAVLVSNLGVQSFWYILLDKFSIFQIWEIVVVGIGLSIFYKIPRNKGYLISVLSVGGVAALHVLATGIGMLLR